MASHPDVIILGGGVIGLTTAYYLAGDGVSVSLIDRGDLGRQASWAGAGIIPPGNPVKAVTPLDRLRAFSSTLYPGLSAELREESGIDNGYLVCGGIELADGFELPTESWRAEGIAFDELDGPGMCRVEPQLAPEFQRGYLLSGMAQVRNPRHVRALIAACEERAVGLLPGCRALSFTRQGDRITAVDTEQGRLSAGKFLIASGAWTDELSEPLGWRPGIVPIRGQIALLNTGTPAIRPILLHAKCYLVPRPDGRILVGSTEESVGFDPRPTAGGIAGLLAFAERLVPHLREATLETCWAGLRPGSPDGLPFVGAVPGFANLFIAAGHFRSGIQLAPGTAVAMTELLLDRPVTVPIEAFRPDRPITPAVRTAFRS